MGTLREKKIYPKWEAEVKGNKVVFKDRETFDTHLVPYEGKPVHVIVKDVSKDRSRQEEKFYHAVVVRMVAEEMFITDEEAHQFLKKMFLTIEEKTKGGYRYTRVLSTTELSDKAYRKYWGDCIKWAAQPTLEDGLNAQSGLSLYIPDPNSVDYENY